MKKKMFWITLLIVLVYPDVILACGGCYRKYLSYVEPYWSVYYKGSEIFGISTFLIIMLINRPLIRRYVFAILLFFIISGILHSFATEGMLGPPAFCLGILFCILWPVFSYLKLMKARPGKKKGYKSIIIAAVLLPFFVLISAHYANNAKAESEKYIQSHLPEMLQRDYGVSINQYARERLLLIRDDQKIAVYKPKLTTLLEIEDGFEKIFAQEVLDQWTETASK